MTRPPLLLDANLLVLAIVGQTNPAYVGRHKRLSEYSLKDFELLTDRLAGLDVRVTPNTLTEASNLLRQGLWDEARLEVMDTLRAVAGALREESVPSAKAVVGEVFLRLGLTDSVLLGLAAGGFALLTADRDLYLAAAAIAPDRTVLFAALREAD